MQEAQPAGGRRACSRCRWTRYSGRMNNNPDKLVVGISSRALFALDASHRVFVEQGEEAYCRCPIERENDILEPPAAVGRARPLLALNTAVRERVEIML